MGGRGGGPDTHCLRRTPAWCMSLQPNALRSSSSSGGMPSSQDGVRSTWTSVASGTRSGVDMHVCGCGKVTCHKAGQTKGVTKRKESSHLHVKSPRQTRVPEDSERMGRARRRAASEWSRARIARPVLPASTGRQRQGPRYTRPRTREPPALCCQWAKVASPPTFRGHLHRRFS